MLTFEHTRKKLNFIYYVVDVASIAFITTLPCKSFLTFYNNFGTNFSIFLKITK